MFVQTLAVVVTSQPQSNLTTTAIDFINTALTIGVNITGVFFYQDGVLNASKYLSIPTDEYQAIQQWKALYDKYQIPLYLCVTAAEKRGLSDELGANNDHSNLHDFFVLSGLGELVELSVNAERVVQF